MTTTTREMPAKVWSKYDGTLRISNDYPTPDRTVTPDDADYAEVKVLADAWSEFCKTHNAANGAPRVLSQRGDFQIKGEVGTVELTRPTEFTQYLAYAADWVTIVAQPQTVPLHSDGYQAFYGFTGVVVSGGRNVSPAGSPGYNTKVGETYTVGQAPYTYQVDDALDSDQTDSVVVDRIDADLYGAWVARWDEARAARALRVAQDEARRAAVSA